MSSAGATIYIPQIPLSNDFKKFNGQLSYDKIEYALNGGEDYELLFTAPRNKDEELLRLSHTLGTPVTKIGEINSSKKLVVLDHDHTPYNTNSQGYDHFFSLNKK